jgi:hypothetical protein
MVPAFLDVLAELPSFFPVGASIIVERSGAGTRPTRHV